MANRLASSTSPYLLQHADNPVDWWPWCDEAFAVAQHRDVPVLLSVGYAACHWCHVMAHESFEDPATATLMNERFVSIKVDREERPDIDAVYMAATQALTGSGGWPMTVVLDHDRHPFFAGTYFPRTARPGMPTFTAVLTALDQAWRTDRPRVHEAAAHLREALTRTIPATPGNRVPTSDDVSTAVQRLTTEFDARRGGFGGAPKFPATPALEFLLRADALLGDRAGHAMDMAGRSLAAMARGGMYDQVGGGFARYSVDADWVVPHFEKMLYDNAGLLRVYVHWWRATADPLARRIAVETGQFMLAELRTEEGAFASSLDADSDGREGSFYVWTPVQLRDVLGDDDGAWVAQLCDVTAQGSFEAGTSVLQRRRDPDDPARWARCRASLAQARAIRTRPPRDDKVVTAWNGLAIAALAEAGALLDEPGFLAAAVTCAEHLADRHWTPERRQLVRTSLAGVANPDAPGVLEDHADLAEGLLTLYQVTGDERWFTWALDLVEVIMERFGDGRGGFFDTASDAPALITRPQDPTDGVTPSGWAAGAQVLLTLGALTGDARHREAADAALAALLPVAVRSPRFTGWSWAAITAALAGPVQVAVVVPAPVPADAAGARAVQNPLHVAALRSTSPGLVLAVGTGGPTTVPLLAERPALQGRPTAYPCRGFVCDLPVHEVADLQHAIEG